VSGPSPSMQALLTVAQAEGFALFACRDCGCSFYPPQSFCPACLSPHVDAQPDSGEATVLSTTRIHRSLDPALAPTMPLYVCSVKSAAGPSLFALADRPWPAATAVRLRVRDGLIHVDRPAP